MHNELLEIKNVTKHFSDKMALNKVNLSVKKGEIIVLVGPNGSGKTTLIRTILNLYNDNIGCITILRKDVKYKFKELGPKIGIMIENAGVYELLTAQEYLKFIMKLISDFSKSEIKVKVEETLKKVGLYEKRNDMIKTFSKGMIQRLAFARAIVNDPILLILDEPFDGIDIETKIQLLKAIKEEKACRGVLITSHNLNEIEDICDRIAIIKDGSILVDNTPELLREENNIYSKLMIKFDSIHSKREIKQVLGQCIYNEDNNIFQVNIKNRIEKEIILGKIQENNLKLNDIFEEKVSLEDIYLNIVNK